ncbi:MAG: hypothetical protein K9N34_02600 [Candidatus Marinimicrobia bacterium]|nr:hypothetical protein [Candidatus Neomarinimicrobiota bacterium]MCF7841168.1 hypothetical protein [Candidatus Neomarinimicrobiota bacterium]MCF7902057.1 hypothetical protein [Candidatus Neomarinimicrobiota bacterium]
MEILTVMVILGVMAVYILPAMYSTYSSVSTSSAVNQVVRDLKYAHEYALAKRDTVWVEFDVPGNGYAIYGGDTVPEKALLESLHDNGDFIVQLGTGVFSKLQLTSASFDGSPNLVIDKFGLPILTSDGTVVINGTYTIQVAAGIGTVTLQ